MNRIGRAGQLSSAAKLAEAARTARRRKRNGAGLSRIPGGGSLVSWRPRFYCFGGARRAAGMLIQVKSPSSRKAFACILRGVEKEIVR